ncbi:hypothetical protein C5Y96_13545 [Blastopirellula marina]|uniref:Metallopeptidase n=1 Tax=Blastopirellula marina TaxID=124 RepID=A0A2S8FGR4_9BACT|nr:MULTISPECIES: hypothetical protein [Pirellulaceae]PQO31359.1 hypothetical protein C5Y96_13545 [Blastopirellula marina]RCS51753.1 hypothetical protein DTL36_13555 [Bremerella cremea]
MQWLMIFAVVLGAETSDQKSQKPDPVSAYHQQSIRGWDVFVHKTLLRDEKETGDAALELIDYQLYEIQRRLPEHAVAALQKIPIWLESDNTEANPCACYHVSADWLGENGFLREKAKAVEVSSAKTFLQWTKEQPFMLLHELSHGYHDRILGYDEPRIIEAFQQAKKSGGYNEVRHIDGSKKKHYAMEDEKEYFAELTEAYFGTNDFYPFVKAELQTHDPEGYRLIETLWNEKPDTTATDDKKTEDAKE